MEQRRWYNRQRPDKHKVQTATAALHYTEGVCGMLVDMNAPQKNLIC